MSRRKSGFSKRLVYGNRVCINLSCSSNRPGFIGVNINRGIDEKVIERGFIDK